MPLYLYLSQQLVREVPSLHGCVGGFGMDTLSQTGCSGTLCALVSVGVKLCAGRVSDSCAVLVSVMLIFLHPAASLSHATYTLCIVLVRKGGASRAGTPPLGAS